jgi:hypothetical protein
MTTQIGRCSVVAIIQTGRPCTLLVVAAISSSQMMPAVFCASLPPWPRL